MARVQMLMEARCVALGEVPAGAGVLQASRRVVEGQGIRGGLLFDGELLMLLMEGLRDAVQALADQWLAQPVLAQAQVLAICEPVLAPGAGPWQAGFVEPGVLEGVSSAPCAEARVGAFLQALAMADVQ